MEIAKRCSVCNEICFSCLTPTEEVSNDASIYIAFSLLGMEVPQFGIVLPDGVANVKLCKVCKSKLTNSLDASGELMQGIKELENKVDLAISQLQTISDLPREGGALLFHHGVINATLKFRALKDILKTAQLSVDGITFRNIVSTQLPVYDGTSSSNLSPVSIVQENEPCTNREHDPDNGEGTMGNETQIEDDVEITIGPVFRHEVKVEPRDETNPEEDEGAPSISEDSEPIVIAEVKVEPPKVVKALGGPSIYHSLEKPTSILKGHVPPGVDTSASSDVPSPVTHLKTETSKLESKMKRKLSNNAVSSPAKKGIAGSWSQASKGIDEDADDNLCIQLCQAVKDTDLDKVKALAIRKDVRKVIEKAISKEKWRSTRLDNVARLITTCAESTLYDEQETIEKKKELLNYLIGVNKNLMFSISKNWKGSWNLKNTDLGDKYSPLLRLDVHPDLILFLLEMKSKLEASRPKAPMRRRASVFNKTPLSDRIEIFVKSFQKVFLKLPKGGCVASLDRYLQSGLISEEQFKLMTEGSRCLNRELDPEGNTLLSLIVRHNVGIKGKSVIETIKTLIHWGASFDWRGRNTEESLLHLAVRKGEVEVVEYFLEMKPSLALVFDKKGFSPLDSVVLEIISHKNIIYEKLFEPFLTIAKKLLQAGAKFVRLYEIQSKILHVIAEHGRNDQAGLKTEFLCRLGLDVNRTDSFGNSPLHLACESLKKCLDNPYPAMELLIELVDNFGEILCRKIIYEDLVNKTLEEKCCGFEDEELSDEEADEPIQNAQFINGLCTILALVHYGANKTQQNGRGETPGDIINRLEIPESIKNVAKRCLN